MLLKEKVVKTRAQHRCFGCNKLFKKGSRLWSWTNAAYGEIYSGYTCLRCLDYLRRLNIDEFMHGELYEHRMQDAKDYLKIRANRSPPMPLADENIALKAEVARLREALENIKKLMSNWLERYHRTGEYPKDYLSAPCNIVLNALTQPAPATPVTDKAQAVINAACAHHINSHYGGPDLLCDCGICKAVEAYRGGA